MSGIKRIHPLCSVKILLLSWITIHNPSIPVISEINLLHIVVVILSVGTTTVCQSECILCLLEIVVYICMYVCNNVLYDLSNMKPVFLCLHFSCLPSTLQYHSEVVCGCLHVVGQHHKSWTVWLSSWHLYGSKIWSEALESSKMAEFRCTVVHGWRFTICDVLVSVMCVYGCVCVQSFASAITVNLFILLWRYGQKLQCVRSLHS